MQPETLAATAGATELAEPGALRLFVEASNESVRLTIRRIGDFLTEVAVSEEDRALIEIALAEILNNVVEHAYAETEDGLIEISAALATPGLQFTIWDDGHPMPAGRLPGGDSARPDLAGHEQAEGGYGLYMIRQLARKLRYERVGDRNRLSFRVALRSM